MSQPHRPHLHLLREGIKVVFSAVRCDAEGVAKYTRAVPRVRARVHAGSTSSEALLWRHEDWLLVGLINALLGAAQEIGPYAPKQSGAAAARLTCAHRRPSTSPTGANVAALVARQAWKQCEWGVEVVHRSYGTLEDTSIRFVRVIVEATLGRRLGFVLVLAASEDSVYLAKPAHSFSLPETILSCIASAGLAWCRYQALRRKHRHASRYRPRHAFLVPVVDAKTTLSATPSA